MQVNHPHLRPTAVNYRVWTILEEVFRAQTRE
jgi:hypothetical protein